MDDRHFDDLAKHLGSRRAAIGGLLAGLFVPLEVAARGKTKNRQRKSKGKNRSRGEGTKHKRANAQAEQCWRAGACIPKKGANVSQRNLAGYSPATTLDCTGCNISRANLRGANLSGANLTKANLSGSCLVDANLSGATIANNTNLYNAIFCNTTMPDGSTNNSGCRSGTACCGTCTEATCEQTCCGGQCVNVQNDRDNCGACGVQCGAQQICDNGTCQSCNVCASGCAHTTVQSAINAASSGATIRICPGSYPRTAGRIAIITTKSLTLVGAGTGAAGTIFQGDPSSSSVSPLVAAGGANTVELRDLTVTGGNTDSVDGGGASVDPSGTLILTRVLVTGNKGLSGAGIWVHANGKLILNAGTTVTNNTARISGGGVYNEGTVTLNPGSAISGNTPDQCLNVSGGSGCP